MGDTCSREAKPVPSGVHHTRDNVAPVSEPAPSDTHHTRNNVVQVSEPAPSDTHNVVQVSEPAAGEEDADVGKVSFKVGEHVANEKVAFGSMPTADFIAGCTSFNLSDGAKKALATYATLNCLRMMGPEEEGDTTHTTWDVWVSFCKEHKLPDEFKKAAAEHVVCAVDVPCLLHGTQVVERAVDNFFRWREVSDTGGVLKWSALANLDCGVGTDTKRTRRALRLLQGDTVHKRGDHGVSSGLKLETALAAFCVKHPAWGDASRSFVFFRDHEKVKALSADAREQLKVTRIQPSGELSYTHAPTVMQHILVTLHSGGEHHEMLNVTKCIVGCFESDMIYQHVVKNKGASSETFLKSIMQLREEDLKRFDLDKNNATIRHVQALGVAAHLTSCGVGLVTEFAVNSTFHGKQVSFKVDDKRKKTGLHAMTLVGYRQDGAHHMFLLQNWWRNKQFIEVSAEYLAAAGAGITFVTKMVTEIPKEFPTDDNVFCMETEDLAEEPVCEGGHGTYPVY